MDNRDLEMGYLESIKYLNLVGKFACFGWVCIHLGMDRVLNSQRLGGRSHPWIMARQIRLDRTFQAHADLQR